MLSHHTETRPLHREALPLYEEIKDEKIKACANMHLYAIVFRLSWIFYLQIACVRK